MKKTSRSSTHSSPAAVFDAADSRQGYPFSALICDLINDAWSKGIQYVVWKVNPDDPSRYEGLDVSNNGIKKLATTKANSIVKSMDSSVIAYVNQDDIAAVLNSSVA